MKRLFAILLLLLLGGSCAHAPPAGPPVVRICGSSSPGSIDGCGRGFIVSDSPYIITAKHVAGGRPILLVHTYKEFFVLMGRFQYDDPNNDVSVVIVNRGEKSDYPLCDPYIDRHEDVYIYGKNGITSGRTIGGTSYETWAIPAAVHGDSGSPVVSVKRQCVVGLVKGYIYHINKKGAEVPFQTLLVPAHVIRRAIAEAEKKRIEAMDKLNAALAPEKKDDASDKKPEKATK